MPSPDQRCFPWTRIVLGITGSVAAYKAVGLASQLSQSGVSLKTVLTQGATHFVTPLSLQAVTGNMPRTELFDPVSEAGMDHIALARWPELILIAPASANLIAKLALGLADDLLSTLCLATQATIAVVPAMNEKMWHHPSTQQHIAILVERGVHILGPGQGHQACGDSGLGRMIEPKTIITKLLSIAPHMHHDHLLGKHILITAGPTRETIDPVRFLSNRSTGRMGVALAEAAHDMGAQVTLVCGPTTVSSNPAFKRINILSAQDMLAAVQAHIDTCDVFIGAAAVADYTPKVILDSKLKKNTDTLQLELVRTQDILAWVASQPNKPFTIGFAAETDHLHENALKKLKNKGCDLIFANAIAGDKDAMAGEYAEVTVLGDTIHKTLSYRSKKELAGSLLRFIPK